MHKSLGNVVFPEEVIAKYGRDTLRWYELGCTTWEDLKFTWKAVEEASRFLNMLWSTYYFASLYMSLDRFDPAAKSLASLSASLRAEDRWILSRLEGLVGRVSASMAGCRVFEAVRDLEEFMREDLSRWYVRLIRKRTWSETEDPDKLAAYATLYEVLLSFLKMAAPIAPFIAEGIYRGMFSCLTGMPESVHMLPWPKGGGGWRNLQLEEDMEIAKGIIEASYSARQAARIKTRQPLLKMRVVTGEARVRDAIGRLRAVVLEQTNVKEVEVITPEEGEMMMEVAVIPNKAYLGPIFRQNSGKVAEAIAALDGRGLLKAFKEGRAVSVDTEVGRVEIRKEYVSLQQKLPENYRAEKSRFGDVCIDTTRSGALMAEGLMRDVIRRIQEMRKRADLKVDAYIRAEVVAPSEEAKEMLQEGAGKIASEVRAKELAIKTGGEGSLPIKEEWDIDGEAYVIGIEEI